MYLLRRRTQHPAPSNPDAAGCGGELGMGWLDPVGSAGNPSGPASCKAGIALGRSTGKLSLGARGATQQTSLYRKNPQLVNNFTSLTQTLVAHRKIGFKKLANFFVAKTEDR